ncbi:MAG: M48 family metalloprotease, partial [Alphaproteobacteria bacterium]|nr:M48 family metalloprotease [Alphaproteobacteria bacterium]
ITFTRFILLIVMACFSGLFAGSLVYSLIMLFQGVLSDLDTALFLKSVLGSGAAIVGLSVIAASPLGDRIAALFFPIRKMSLRDEEKINPVVERIQKIYRQKHGRDIKIRVFVMDMPHINGIALGRETVAVSTGLLKAASEEEIASILAHEAGHLHNGDGFFNMALIAASYPTLFLNNLLKNMIFFGPKPRWFPASGQDFGWMMGMFTFLMALLFFAYFIFFWVLSIPVLWLLRSVEFFTAWPIEYRADRFAMELGFGPPMIELFERIEDEDVRGATGFLAKYLYSHPPTALRIDRIERALGASAESAA